MTVQVSVCCLCVGVSLWDRHLTDVPQFAFLGSFKEARKMHLAIFYISRIQNRKKVLLLVLEPP